VTPRFPSAGGTHGGRPGTAAAATLVEGAASAGAIADETELAGAAPGLDGAAGTTLVAGRGAAASTPQPTHDATQTRKPHVVKELLMPKTSREARLAVRSQTSWRLPPWEDR
jgi:hypothetical protein